VPQAKDTFLLAQLGFEWLTQNKVNLTDGFSSDVTERSCIASRAAWVLGGVLLISSRIILENIGPLINLNCRLSSKSHF
jgi:hypothetical protein